MVLKNLTSKQLSKVFTSVNFKTKPYWHQLVCLTWSLDKNYCAYFLDVGTGKTLIALYTALLQNSPTILVVSPKSVLKTWEEQIKEHTDFSHIELSGTKEERQHLLNQSARIYTINYEGLQVLFSKKVQIEGKNKHIPAFSSIPRFDMIIFDESHHLKNTKALQSIIAYKLARKAKKIVLLTGTPVAKDARDLWSQFHILDGGRTLGTSYWKFLNKYFHQPWYEWEPKKVCPLCNQVYTKLTDHIRETKEAKDIYEYRRKTKALPKVTTADHILELVTQASIRFSIEECVNLPSKTYEKRYGKMTVEQVEMEMIVLSGLAIELKEGILKKTTVLNRSQKLSQITGGFVYGTEGAVRFNDNPKLELLQECLNEIGEKQVIIYHAYVEEGRIIEEFCKKEKITFSSLRSEIKNKNKSVEDFTSGKVRVLIAHPDSGGEGIDGLQCSNYVIFYSNVMSSIKRMQAEGRSYRTKQTKPVVIFDLLLEDSVDEEIHNALTKKKDTSDAVLKFIKEHT